MPTTDTAAAETADTRWTPNPLEHVQTHMSQSTNPDAWMKFTVTADAIRKCSANRLSFQGFATIARIQQERADQVLRWVQQAKRREANHG